MACDDPYGSVLQPQVVAIIQAVFRALESAPSSLLEKSTQQEPSQPQSHKLKRFGLDLLVDEDLHVWLIEVNVLKGRPKGYGLGASKGPGGDMKTEMVRFSERFSIAVPTFVRFRRLFADS